MKYKFWRVGAFSLVEVTLALGVASFCLVAVLGLLPVGIQTNQAAIQQTTANTILSSIISDMRSAPVFPRGNGVVSKQFSHTFPNTPTQFLTTTLYFHNDGSTTTTPTTADANTTFYATVTFLSPTTGSRTASLYDVKVAWPYAASGNGNGNGNSGTPAPRGYVETVVALDIN